MSPFDRFFPLLHGRSFARPRDQFRHEWFPEALVILNAPNRPWICINCPRVYHARRDLPIEATAVRCEKKTRLFAPELKSRALRDSIASEIIVKFRGPRSASSLPFDLHGECTIRVRFWRLTTSIRI